MLNHGGNLQKAKASYQAFDGEWTDLSTGISPWSWPVPQVPEAIWQRLPEKTASFEQAVTAYYGLSGLQLVPGSQFAIEGIPHCLPATAVAIPRWGYGEHARGWQRAGHKVVYYDAVTELPGLLNTVEHVVVINPNNPTGEICSVALLRQLQRAVSGYLLVDEAFIDAAQVDASLSDQLTMPSMLPYIEQGSLIVLRSLGKFFGLAGLRMGFVGLPQPLADQLMARLPLWSVSTPGLWLAEQALNDKSWQRQQCRRIHAQRSALKALLSALLAQSMYSGCTLNEGPLFIALTGPRPVLKNLFEQFACQGIWLRLFEPRDQAECTYLRFGLPKNLDPIERVLNNLAGHPL